MALYVGVSILGGVGSVTPPIRYNSSSISLHGDSDMKEPCQIRPLVHTPKVDCFSLGALACNFVSSSGVQE